MTDKQPIVKPKNPPIPKKKKKRRKVVSKKKVDPNMIGRPLKFENKEVLEKEIKKYFESCFEEQWKERDWRDEKWFRQKDGDGWRKEPYKELVMIKIPTISGLAVALDTSRRTLVNYEEKEEFFHTIKEAKQFIESVIEEWALKWWFNPTFSIFNLKNNFDWKDKTESENTFKGSLTLADWLIALTKTPQKDEK